MPLYEYRCKDCARRFTMLIGMLADSREPACPKCGSANLQRLMSRFGALRSEDAILDDLADPDRIGDVEDPKVLRKWVKEMGKSMGDDMEDDFEELLEEAVEEEASGEGGGPGAPDPIY